LRETRPAGSRRRPERVDAGRGRLYRPEDTHCAMAEGGPARIELRLRELTQLFNSMDPSPFPDRDLDADAEEFILSWARELPRGRELELVIRLGTPVRRGRSPAEVEDAVHRYFASRALMKRAELRLLLRRGRVSLCVGLVFLAACLAAGQYVAGKTGPLAGVARESLSIAGWVAMWRPIQTYLYDWWPLRDDLQVLDRLARMRVGLEVESAHERPPETPANGPG
jgi:hypothetical protein